MLEPMFQFVEKFITDFSWRRLTIFFGIIVLIATSFMAYEWQTATNELSRYERSTAILQELDKLIDSKHPEIIEVTKSIISRINLIIDNDSLIEKFEFSVSSEISQALLATLPWMLFFLIMLPSVLKGGNTDANNTALGFGFFIIIVGAISYFIPTNWSNWIRYGIPQFLNVLIIIYFSIKGSEE